MNAISQDLKRNASKQVGGTPFMEMSPANKTMFALRVLVCFLTFGFICKDALND